MEAHYADLRLPAAARHGWDLCMPEPDAALAAQNAADAAAIDLSVDLEAHSAASLALLHEVHQHPQLADPTFLRVAVRRYERYWLPLLAAAADARTASDALPGTTQEAAQAQPCSPAAAAAAAVIGGNGETAADCDGGAAAPSPLAAPLDIAWVWMAHTIAPVHYRKDTEALLGPTAAATLWASAVGAVSAPHTRPPEALAATQQLWERRFPQEPFDAPQLRQGPGSGRLAQPAANTTSDSRNDGGGSSGSVMQYNLVAACERQYTFYWSTCLPHYREGWMIRRAVARHRRFLHLHALFPGIFISPAYDQDLVWHTHMACSPQYFADCTKLYGAVFPHDDSVNDRTPGAKLSNAWRTTQGIWWQTYDELLPADGAMWRGPLPVDWSLGPPDTGPGHQAAASAPRVFALVMADTNRPLRPVANWNYASPARVMMAVRACAAGGDSGDYILLLQHSGPDSRTACVQVFTPGGRLEATARLVGRETLPTRTGDTAASTPALTWSSADGAAHGAALDRKERAFCVCGRRGDWGVSIARWTRPSAGGSAARLDIDLFRLHPRSGEPQGPLKAAIVDSPNDVRLRFPAASWPKAVTPSPSAARQQLPVATVTCHSPGSAGLRRGSATEPPTGHAATKGPSAAQRPAQAGDPKPQRRAKSTLLARALAAVSPAAARRQRRAAAVAAAARTFPDTPAGGGFGICLALGVAAAVQPLVHTRQGASGSSTDGSTRPQPAAGPVAVAVGLGEAAPEALAFAGAAALQAMMLGSRDAAAAQLFHQGLFAATGLGPPAVS